MKKKLILIISILTIILLSFLYIFFKIYRPTHKYDYRSNETAGHIIWQSRSFSDNIKKNNIKEIDEIEKIKNNYPALKDFKLVKYWSWCFLYELSVDKVFSKRERNWPSVANSNWKKNCYEKNDEVCKDYNECKFCLNELWIMQREKQSNCK